MNNATKNVSGPRGNNPIKLKILGARLGKHSYPFSKAKELAECDGGKLISLHTAITLFQALTLNKKTFPPSINASGELELIVPGEPHLFVAGHLTSPTSANDCVNLLIHNVSPVWVSDLTSSSAENLRAAISKFNVPIFSPELEWTGHIICAMSTGRGANFVRVSSHINSDARFGVIQEIPIR